MRGLRIVIALGAAVAAVGATAGCVESSLVVCENGRICPVGTACDEVHSLCVQPEQLTACDGLPDRADCDVVAAGRCYDGVCLARGCGNGFQDLELDVRASEMCDDGNTASGDGCSADCKSDEQCGNGVVDQTLEIAEQCDDGNRLARDGCSSTCVAEQPRWRLHAPVPFRSQHAMAYDPRRQRVVLFGGSGRNGSGTTDVPTRDDTWEWDGTSWTLSRPGIFPLARTLHAMVYDGASNRILLFGGQELVDRLGDLWAWDGTTWTRDDTAMLLPPPTSRHAMTYDSKRRRVVLAGGSTLSGFGNTWVMENGIWRELPASSIAREDAGMAYDPVRDQVVVFGGADTDTATLVLEGDTWRTIPPSVGSPAPRMYPVLAFDSVSERVIMYGGGVEGTFTSETWAWNGAAWEELKPVHSPYAPSDRFAMASDPHRGRIVLFGGLHLWDPQSGEPEPNATWEWNGTDWLEVAPVGAAPSPRSEHAIATDPLRRTLLLFGGDTQAETWIWDGAWQSVPVAVPPPPRVHTVLVSDTTRRQIVMFGGGSTGLLPFLDDTLVWDGAQWMAKDPPSFPPKRREHAGAFHADRDEVLVFGGQGDEGLYDDLWAWNGATWTQKLRKGPLPRRLTAMAYDPINRQTVLFGGFDNDQDLADTWLWNGDEWTLAQPPVSPPARRAHSMTWDPARRKVVLFGGGSGTSVSRNDLWEWTGSEWNRIEIPGSPSPRVDAKLGWDRGALIVFGGGPLDCCGNILDKLDETWRLQWESAAPYETCSAVDTDGDTAAGCADPDCALVCQPTCDPLDDACTESPRCGDDVCELSEDCTRCPRDCGPCDAVCGDFACAAGEATTCGGDCP